MLRITGSMFEDSGFYNGEFRAQAAETFRLASRIAEIRELLRKIKERAESLRLLFLTEEERIENRNAVKVFDSKMQNMVCATFANLEKYQLSGWEELFDTGDES
jgi:hypothetical protein